VAGQIRHPVTYGRWKSRPLGGRSSLPQLLHQKTSRAGSPPARFSLPRFLSWEIGCNLLTFHVRFFPQLGKKRRGSNEVLKAAKAQQKTPDGYYNVERMLKRVLSNKGSVLLCGTCMEVRGLGDAELLEGARRSTMGELAAATAEADKVLVF
jgi:DsrE/DsrF-like family